MYIETRPESGDDGDVEVEFSIPMRRKYWSTWIGKCQNQGRGSRYGARHCNNSR